MLTCSTGGISCWRARVNRCSATSRWRRLTWAGGQRKGRSIFMELLTADKTRALLPYVTLAEQIEGVLRDRRAGLVYAPPRLSMPMPGGATLLLMPAGDSDTAIT